MRLLDMTHRFKVGIKVLALKSGNFKASRFSSLIFSNYLFCRKIWCNRKIRSIKVRPWWGLTQNVIDWRLSFAIMSYIKKVRRDVIWVDAAHSSTCYMKLIEKSALWIEDVPFLLYDNGKNKWMKFSGRYSAKSEAKLWRFFHKTP